MTRTRTIALVALLAASIPAAAFAFGGGHRGPRADSAEEAREHAGRMIDRGLDRVDATDAQRAQIDTVLDRAVPALYAVREDGAALREESRGLLTAEKIDRAAAEELRQDGVALFDQGSRIMTNAMLDIASVLTVEQRKELGALMDRFHDRADEGQGGPGRGERRGK